MTEAELLSSGEAERRTREALARVAGPLVQLTWRGDPRQWAVWYQGQVQGRPVRVGLGDYHGQFDAAYFCASIAGLPVRLNMIGRSRRPIGPEDFTTGDARFDAEFWTTCFPHDVFRAALGDGPRGWLLETFAGSHPNMNTAGGFLHVRVPLGREGFGRRTRAMAEDELVLWIERMRDFEARLHGAYAGRRAEIAATQGEAAAQAWAEGHERQLAAEEAARRARRRIVFLALGIAIAVPVLATLGLLAWLLAGCSSREPASRPAAAPPAERMRVVAAAEAPVLPEPQGDEPPSELLRPGDLVSVVRSAGALEWAVGGRRRSGELLEVRRSAGDGFAFVFAGDLGGEVTVAPADGECAALGSPPGCPDRLRRVAIAGGVLAYDPCHRGGCGVSFTREGQRDRLALDGLVSLAPAVAGRPVALATVRWVKAPAWTGASVAVLDFAGGLRRALIVEVEANDARSSPAVQQQGELGIDGETLVYRGTRREVSLTTGEVLATTPILQTTALPAAEQDRQGEKQSGR